MLMHRNLAGKSEHIKSDNTREILGRDASLRPNEPYVLLSDSEHIFFAKDGTI